MPKIILAVNATSAQNINISCAQTHQLPHDFAGKGALNVGVPGASKPRGE